MQMNRLIAPILALAFLSACLHAADKKVPAAQSALPPSMSLDDCIRLALVQNPLILKARQQIEQTHGLIIEVRAQAIPQFGIVSGYNQESTELIQLTNQPGQQDKTWNISFQATQLLYSGGQVGAAIKIAKLTNDSNVYALRDTVDQVISTVRKQFYDVLLDKALIGVQEESVNLLQSQLKDQKNRFEAGTVPRFNVLQAEVALSNQIPLLIKARNDYTIAQLAIAKTLGVQYNTWHPGKSLIEAAGELTIREQSIDQNTAVSLAKERRSFLKIQRQNILIQLQQIKVALSGYQPQISAKGGWELRNSSLTNDLDHTVNGWFFGVQGNWNIFDGLATYGKVKEARAQLESAKITYDDSVLQVELEVQQALANLREARETIDSQTKNVEEALEALRLAQERLSAGAGTQLDVLNGQVSLALARTNKLQALHDYNVALAELDRVTGVDTQYTDSFKDPLDGKKPAAAAKPKPSATPAKN
jgi:outer membrane protein TolC